MLVLYWEYIKLMSAIAKAVASVDTLRYTSVHRGTRILRRTTWMVVWMVSFQLLDHVAEVE